jgi:hypothetical protein
VPPAAAAVAAKVEAPAAAPAEEPKPPADEPSGPAAEEEEPHKGPAAATMVSVMVRSDPEGSHVSTRHRSYGTTPVALKLRPGATYELSFSKPGYVSQSKRYHVTDRETQNVRVALKKVPEPPKPAAKETPKAGAKATPKKATAAAEPKAAPEKKPPPEKKKGWFTR